MDPIIDFLGFNIVLEIEFDFGSLVNGYFSFSDLKDFTLNSHWSRCKLAAKNHFCHEILSRVHPKVTPQIGTRLVLYQPLKTVQSSEYLWSLLN